MIRKLDFFLHLYDKRKEIYNFLLALPDSPFYHRPEDILINNRILISFKVENNTIFYCDTILWHPF